MQTLVTTDNKYKPIDNNCIVDCSILLRRCLVFTNCPLGICP